MKSLVDRFRDELVLVLGMTDVRSVAKHYGFKHVITCADIAEKYPQLIPHVTEHGKTKARKLFDESHKLVKPHFISLFLFDFIFVVHSCSQSRFSAGRCSYYEV